MGVIRHHCRMTPDTLTQVIAVPVSASSRRPPSAPSAGVPRAGSQPTCSDSHWIQSVSSQGEIVTLEDGSIWEIAQIDHVNTMLWLPTEDVVACDGRLINTDNGDAVDATRLK